MEQRNVKKIENLEQELSRIRQEIERRKKEPVEEAGVNEQKEKIISETLKSHIEENPSDTLHENYRLKKEEIEKHIKEIESEDDDRKIEELMRIVREKGVINAVRICENLKNPHILDDLHRRLIHYFNFETDNK